MMASCAATALGPAEHCGAVEATLQLGADEVHLWFTEPRIPAAAAEEYESLLPADELARMRRFVEVRDRIAYLVARALLRTTLSRYAPVAPGKWRFEIGARGKPHIVADHALAAGLTMNLSHTDGLVVLGLARRRAIGVDVESLRRRNDLSVAEQFFCPDETEALHALDPALRPLRFVELWTLKESYLKATGAGLALPLDTVGFRIAATHVLADLRGHGAAGGRWTFWQFRPTREHVSSLCAETRGDGPIRLRVMGCVPMRSEWPADRSITRTSLPAEASSRVAR